MGPRVKRYATTVLALLCALVLALAIVRSVRDALRPSAPNPMVTVSQ